MKSNGLTSESSITQNHQPTRPAFTFITWLVGGLLFFHCYFFRSLPISKIYTMNSTLRFSQHLFCFPSSFIWTNINALLMRRAQFHGHYPTSSSNLICGKDFHYNLLELVRNTVKLQNVKAVKLLENKSIL